MISTPRKAKEVFTDSGSNIGEVVPSLASISASLFPIISVYPGTQTSSILAPLALRALVANIALIYWLWPGLLEGVFNLSKPAWLSV